MFGSLDASQTDPTICIQEVALYGQDLPLAQPGGYMLQPVSHEPGGSHSISPVLVASLSDYGIQEIRHWSRTGARFVRLHWTFPGHPYPQFTTSHLLSMDDSSGNVSFSGGLHWAQDMLEAAQELHLTNPGPPPVVVHLPVPGLVDVGGQPTLQQPFFPGWFHGIPDFDLSEDAMFLPSGSSDDQESLCSELTEGTTISDSGTACSFADAEEALISPPNHHETSASSGQRCPACFQDRTPGAFRRSRRLESPASRGDTRRPRDNPCPLCSLRRSRSAQGQHLPNRRLPNRPPPPPLPPPQMRLAHTTGPVQCCAPLPQISFTHGAIRPLPHVLTPNDDWGGHPAGEVRHHQEQDGNASFHREIQNARDMYALNGDTSGFHAVMAAAPHFYVPTFDDD